MVLAHRIRGIARKEFFFFGERPTYPGGDQKVALAGARRRRRRRRRKGKEWEQRNVGEVFPIQSAAIDAPGGGGGDKGKIPPQPPISYLVTCKLFETLMYCVPPNH